MRSVSPLSLIGFRTQDTVSHRRGFDKDEHIPDLLRFHPRVTFHEDECYKRGKIILQDKASCFPAVVLNPPVSEHAVVIDATAAPGNKTSHLSALMQGKGKVRSSTLDTDPIIQRSTSPPAALRLRARSQEISDSDPHVVQSGLQERYSPQYRFPHYRSRIRAILGCHPHVRLSTPTQLPLSTRWMFTHVSFHCVCSLLDPSCSGSGIVNRLDYLLDTGKQHLVHFRSNPLTKTFMIIVIRGKRSPRRRRPFVEARGFPAHDDKPRHEMYSGAAQPRSGNVLIHLLFVLSSPTRAVYCVLDMQYPRYRERACGERSSLR